MSRRSRETFPCPACGADVPTNAKACPECGSDEETGWSEEAEYSGLDLPGHEDDDDLRSVRSSGSTWQWVVIATATALALFYIFYRYGTVR